MPEGAIYVGRPSKWGNPIRMEDWQGAMQSLMIFGCRGDKRGLAEATVKAFRLLLNPDWRPVKNDARNAFQKEAYTLRCSHVAPMIDAIRTELKGKDLVCWCALDMPCHADVLLEIANAE